MRVLSSEVHLSSTSSYFKRTRETVYELDEYGQVVNKSRETSVEERTTNTSVHTRTGIDYTVDLYRNSDAVSTTQKSVETESALDLDDDLEKNLYMASVFEWAADTIDTLIDNFKSMEQPDETSQGNISIYREVSCGYRDKAKALRPDSLTISDNRIRKTKSLEIEAAQVQAGGVVHTADGQSIDFTLNVVMHRENKKTKTEIYRLVDPLVINFSNTSAKLENETFMFDLDGNGDQEEVSRLNQGSGFLALDLNQDGEVNNGLELFGPLTGNGFQELALYDDDKNGWIDETDTIYDQLMVWIQNDTDKGILEKLSATGIGAIHLSSVTSEFLVEDSHGRAAGKIAATGIALTDSGEVKTVQQVDLIV